MPKHICEPSVAGKVVARGIIHAPLEVSKVSGDWLWVGRAWVLNNHVVPLESADTYYSEFLRTNPQSGWAYCFRGITRELLGDAEGAARDFADAIRVAPNFPMGYSQRANIAERRGDIPSALQDMNTAIRLDPKNPSYYTRRGYLWSRLSDWPHALADADEALRLDPQSSAAFNNRGQARQLGFGDYELAAADFSESIRLDPEQTAAYSNRAFLAATAVDAKFRNGKQAVADAERACKTSDWKIARCVRTLAAAHAENGNFDEAVSWQQKAIELATNDETLLPELREQLQLYQAGVPYRRPPANATQVRKPVIPMLDIPRRQRVVA